MKLTHIEISKSALAHNLKMFRSLVGNQVTLAPAVKANAYGHGLVECARIFEENGANVLCVDAIYEAEKLRKAGIRLPLLIIGYTPLSQLNDVINLKCEQVIYNSETIQALAKIKKEVGIHLKIETGTHRQGIALNDLPNMIDHIKRHSHIKIRGISTHFANLEDRMNHQYALYQLEQFDKAIHLLEENKMAPRFRHAANTAAAILLPEAHFNFVRVGIGAYGLWPSEKTKKAAKRAGIKMTLEPALTWKTIIAQIKEVKKGALIGYGCAYEMPKNGKIAVIPVGYYDGYVRAMSGNSHILIQGEKAPVIGRICMNIFMADVSRISNAKLEDEVVLIGRQGKNSISAENVADWSGTINYEVTTRINERIPRLVKE